MRQSSQSAAMDTRATVERLERLTTRLLFKAREDQLIRERVRERWYCEMAIVMDCATAALKTCRPRPSCPLACGELATLLDDTCLLFREGRADLERMLCCKDETVSAATFELEKCALDLRDVVEAVMEEEQLRSASFAELKQRVTSLERENRDLEADLRSLEQRTGELALDREGLTDELDVLKDQNYLKQKELARLRDEASRTNALEEKLSIVQDSLREMEMQNVRLSSIRRELDEENKRLVDQNNMLAREADQEHSEVRRLRARDEDQSARIITVDVCSPAGRNLAHS